MGDMNAKVGKDNTGRELIMGKEGIGDINENGELFADFCSHNDLVIGGTTFPHKDIHKTTWISPDTKTRNQIDHITVARRWRKSMIDVRAYRGADIASDHQLVIAKFRVKIARATRIDQLRNKRYNIKKLKDPQVIREFSTKLTNRFQALSEIDDGTVEKKWEMVKSAYNSTCIEELGFSKKEHKIWLSDDTIETIEQRRSLKIQLEQAKTRSQKERLNREHTKVKNEVNKKSR